MATVATKTSVLGMIGLGVMGRNLLLNMSDHDFSVSGYDLDIEKVNALKQDSKNGHVFGADNLKDFIESLREPRVVMLLIPAGPAVDDVIKELIPLLQKGDIIIDGGNSFYKDTAVREKNLAKLGIYFLGVGISGGEEGARHGPSIMPGGPREAYDQVKSIFEACAAQINNKPCVAYLGPGAAGHFVKMVHNGIEYAIMQLISETYDLLKRGAGFRDEELSSVYIAWNNGELNSYLLEITAHIFSKVDKTTGNRLVDEILDVAEQKGTGKWTSEAAMDLQVPTPTIDIAVAMRNLSMSEQQRNRASNILKRAIHPFTGDRIAFVEILRHAFCAAMIITYAQGMALLNVASEKLGYHLDLEAITRIWRGGCIIRAALLEDIRTAFKKDPHLPNLLLDSELSVRVMANEQPLRHIVRAAAEIGVPAPAFMTTLSYLDSYRSGWLPANLIQAQRDYFGSHTYERIDEKGTFHTDWEKTVLYENKRPNK